MSSYCKELVTEIETEGFAAHCAKFLTPPLILSFSGEIGSGKTTFIRAFLRALGLKSPIKSPTFSLVESYSFQHLQIHHFDLYRIHEESELEYIGFRDYFLPNSICCIEWPERASHSLDSVDMNFNFKISGNGRIMTISALTKPGETLLSTLKADYE